MEQVGACAGPPKSDPPDIEHSPEEMRAISEELPYPANTGYFSYEVQSYTVFGIPFGKISLRCNEPG